MVASFSVLFNQASAGGIRSEHPVAIMKRRVIKYATFPFKKIILNYIPANLSMPYSFIYLSSDFFGLKTISTIFDDDIKNKLLPNRSFPQIVTFLLSLESAM